MLAKHAMNLQGPLRAGKFRWSLVGLALCGHNVGLSDRARIRAMTQALETAFQDSMMPRCRPITNAWVRSFADLTQREVEVLRDVAKGNSNKIVADQPYVPAGRSGLFDFIKSLPATLRYENALAAAEGDEVILHGRFSGHRLARSWIVGDVVRLQNGVLVEHWDVIQNEAIGAESKSGRPMFGLTFAPAIHRV